MVGSCGQELVEQGTGLGRVAGLQPHAASIIAEGGIVRIQTGSLIVVAQSGGPILVEPMKFAALKI